MPFHLRTLTRFAAGVKTGRRIPEKSVFPESPVVDASGPGLVAGLSAAVPET